MVVRARGLALLVVLLAACPARTRRVGTPSPGPPEAPAVAVKPLEAADLARDPLRGLVLGAGGPGHARPVRLAGRPTWLQLAAPSESGWGTFWLIARPTDPRATPNPILPPAATPDPSAPDPASPDPALETPPDPASPAAGTTQARPPSGPPLSDPAWTRSLWLARRAASAAIGRKPTDFQLAAVARRAQVTPPTDATLAVAAIAALTGTRLSRSSVVVARLEPDGSLAPVDDPLAEMQRALRRGARRIILPLGGGLASAGAGQKPIDLIQLGRQAGATPLMVPDLVAAYRALTSSALPEPQPLVPADLALTRAEVTAVEKAYRRALERIAAGWPRLIEQQNRARLPPPMAALVAGAERGARRGERSRAAGDPAAAYVRVTEAAALADAATRLDTILRSVGEGDLERARAEIESARAAPEVARLVPPGGAAPATVGEHLRAIGLFSLAASSWAWSEEAAARSRAASAEIDALAKLDRSHLTARVTARKVADAVAPLLIASARARLGAGMVQDRAEMEPGGGPGFAAHADTLRALAAGESAAAGASLAELTPAASQAEPGWTLPAHAVAASRMLALLDEDGDLARASGRARVPPDRSPLLALAVAMSASDRLADALARARRLRPRIDPWTGQVVALGRPSWLKIALQLAERAALQQAGAARVAVGSIPLGARLAFTAAAALARGDRIDRIDALELYQIASAECRMAVLLALSEEVAPTPAAGSEVARAGCPPSPSAPRSCR